MKHKLLVIGCSVWLLHFFWLGSVSVFAQTSRTTTSAEEQTRDLVKQYQTGKADGVQVIIYLKGADGSLLSVAPSHEFRAEDEVKFSLRSNFHGYVYLVNQGASGKYRLLFPGGAERNLIQPGEEKLFPSSYPIVFDKTSGKEIVQVFLSKQRIGFFAGIARRDDGLLNDAEVAQLQKLWKSSDAQMHGIQKLETINTGKSAPVRAIETRDPIFDLPKKTTLVVIPRPKKVAPQQTAASAFTINLKNNGASQ